MRRDNPKSHPSISWIFSSGLSPTELLPDLLPAHQPKLSFLHHLPTLSLAPQEPFSLTLVQEVLQVLPAFLPTKEIPRETHFCGSWAVPFDHYFIAGLSPAFPLLAVCSLSLTSKFSQCFSLCEELLEAPQSAVNTSDFFFSLSPTERLVTDKHLEVQILSPGADSCPPLFVFFVLSCQLFFVRNPRGTWSLGNVLKYFYYC